MFTMKVKTDNAAFEGENRWYELARLLKYIAQQIEDGHPGKPLQDINGNTVGTYKLT